MSIYEKRLFLKIVCACFNPVHMETYFKFKIWNFVGGNK